MAIQHSWSLETVNSQPQERALFKFDDPNDGKGEGKGNAGNNLVEQTATPKMASKTEEEPESSLDFLELLNILSPECIQMFENYNPKTDCCDRDYNRIMTKSVILPF